MAVLCKHTNKARLASFPEMMTKRKTNCVIAPIKQIEIMINRFFVAHFDKTFDHCVY